MLKSLFRLQTKARKPQLRLNFMLTSKTKKQHHQEKLHAAVQVLVRDPRHRLSLPSAAAAASGEAARRFLFFRSIPRANFAMFSSLMVASFRCFAFRMVRVMIRT